MEKIIYTRPDGGISVVHPAEGFRLATALKQNGKILVRSEVAVPVDSLRRGWPIPGVTAQWAETEGEFVARVRAKVVPADAINVQVVDGSTIPSDRTFRDAWAVNGGAVAVDMPKAREIHKDRMRSERAPKLAALDIEFIQAVEADDKTKQADIAARKQALRDVTDDPAIEAAGTPEDLKAVLPDALK